MVPVHNFEMSGGKGGLMGMFSGKPQLSLFDSGIGWSEGKDKKFVEFVNIKQLKYSKYYSTVTIIHSEIKKVTLLNIRSFETVWSDFARTKGLTVKLIAE
ncbi:MAG: hypothetical protein FWC70_00880 [Defluviitaleaceae bacterium]|nr:hypothetical protein [Defluviitaleaceae bacterium]